MSCEMCSYTIGNPYYLYPPITCDTCKHVQKAPIDAVYIDFYARLVHHFRPVRPCHCEKCGTRIVVINRPCRDFRGGLEQQEQDRLVESLFDKVKEKVRVR
jgi:hypothetical protein